MRRSSPRSSVGGRLVVAAVLALALASCSSGDRDPEAAPGGDAEVAADAGIVRLAEYRSVRGIQLRLVAAHSSDEELTVVLEASSGSLNPAELSLGRARLTADGEPVPPARTSGDLVLGWGDDAQVELIFPVDGRPERFDLLVPGPFAVSGHWEFDDVRLADQDEIDLPASFAVGHRELHPQGTQLEIGAVAFTESRIGLSVVVRNGGEAVYLVTGDDTYLEDDLGNRYLSIGSEVDEPNLQVEPGSELSGTLVFAGAIAPGATSLSLGVNTGMGGSLDSRLTPKPAFRVDDLALDGGGGVEAPAGLPEPLEIAERRDHPSGVSATIQRIAFDETSIRVTAELSNPNSHDVQVQPSGVLVDTVIEDDLGNEHELLTEQGEDTHVVIVPGGASVGAELVFAGRVDDAASSLRIAFNEGTTGAAEHRTTLTPTFVWEELSVPDRRAGPDIDPEDVIVPARSDLTAEALDRSSAEVVARTVEDLDGAETSAGVLLVLPERVLFDFGSDVLREDAGNTLADLAGVLEYFAGEPVEVVGHTDSIGSEQSNQTLSERRASAVTEALVDLGVDRGRISASGWGESEPAAPNTRPDGSDDPDGRQENRRVEVLVRTDEPLPTG